MQDNLGGVIFFVIAMGWVIQFLFAIIAMTRGKAVQLSLLDQTTTNVHLARARTEQAAIQAALFNAQAATPQSSSNH
jgi:hypothetical protein